MKILSEVLAFANSFSFQLIAAELFVCFPFRKRKTFALGILLMAAIALVFSRALSPYMPWKEYETFSRWPYFWIGEYFNAGLLIVFFLTFAAVLLCFRERPTLLLLACICSYIMQNLGYQAVETFRYALFGEGMTAPYRAVSVAVNFLVFFGLSFLLRRIFRGSEDFLPGPVFAVTFSAIALLIIVGFSTFITLLDHTNSLLHIYALICCALLIGEIMNVFSKNRAAVEKQKMEEIFQKSAWQYERSQNSADLINRKCHDLRHELEALRRGVPDAEKKAYMAELSRIIETYDTSVQTGNRTLDTILSEKYESCLVKGIEFSYTADGASLQFMQTIDLYTMLGNAFDNAIEAEECEDEGCRYIYFRVVRENALVTVTIENYCSRELHIEGGIPVTSKEDRACHGYGIKSIRAVAEKYGGHCKIESENGCFRLILLFCG